MTSLRNRQLDSVRMWLHERVCASEHCTGQLSRDHARRTQHEHARDIVDAPDDEFRRRAVHDALCPHAARGLDCYDSTSGAHHPPEVLDGLLRLADETIRQA